MCNLRRWLVLVLPIIASCRSTVTSTQTIVDLRIGSYQSRCIVAGNEASVVSLAKSIAEKKASTEPLGGMSETTVVLDPNDCYRLRGFSWEAPEGKMDDRVYDERRARLRKQFIFAARVISDADGTVVYVRNGQHLRREGAGRIPDDIVLGKNLCRLLQISGGQETEVAGTRQAVAFVSCRPAKVNLIEGSELLAAIRKKTGIGGPFVTQVTIMINACSSFRNLAFPVWYAFDNNDADAGCGKDWKSMVFSWQKQLCVTNEDGQTCTQR